MIEKAVLIVVIVLMLGVSSWFLYQNMPGTPEMFRGNILNVSSFNSGSVAKVFYPSMRFESPNISYYIDSSCSKQKRDRIVEAFTILSQNVGALTFYPEITNNSEILIGCSKDFISNGENVIVAGEGGPSKIINTGEFNIILSGRITIYRDSSCDYPVIELHEILHVFGFDHVNSSSDIMYPYSSCDQRISTSEVTTLQAIYSVEQLPDLYFSNVSATKNGRYLDFSAEIRNAGLKDSGNSTLMIYDSANNTIGSFNIGSIFVGAGRVLYAQNVKLPSRDTGSISFEIIDGRELNMSNNHVDLNVWSAG